MDEKIIDIFLPKFGRMQEATITEWFKSVGDIVKEGEPIFAIETDKANQDIEAESSGMLAEIRVEAGNVVQVGDVIGLISVGAPGTNIQKAQLEADKIPPESDLSLQAMEKIPFTGMRKAIAEGMSSSLRDSAQLTLMSEVDVTASAEARPNEVSPTAIIVQIVAQVLVAHPRLNSSLIEDEILVWNKRNIGVAIAVEEGLIVPVIQDADTKDVRSIAEEIETLAQKAREGVLTEKELQGGTFTITNLGMFGIDAFTPIINTPEVAILGVGRWVEKPQVVEGQIKVLSVGTLSLTLDHRVVDGAPGAKFLKDVAERLKHGDYT